MLLTVLTLGLGHASFFYWNLYLRQKNLINIFYWIYEIYKNLPFDEKCVFFLYGLQIVYQSVKSKSLIEKQEKTFFSVCGNFYYLSKVHLAFLVSVWFCDIQKSLKVSHMNWIF